MFTLKLSSKDTSEYRIIFIHGWGNTHLNMLQLANLFERQTENYVIDLVGNGKSPPLEKAYGSDDYANDVLCFMKELPTKKTIIVGHSNGGRVAIKLANKANVDGIVLIGGAGIPPQYNLCFKIRLFLTKKLKFLKKIFPFLTKFIGSAEYVNTSGFARETFKKLVGEDLREDAKRVKIPTLLIYGTHDTATPVYMGETYKSLIKNSQLEIIAGANHFDLVTNNSKIVHNYITRYMREL
ncbi:MAG: alpha/beta hydrolase [Rickettsiales bacterium]|jgi:pimeloyl-ACP methyl ester carboxylesterase|nr:alpha/beta hydrolase [Rickettsiales bacterium]